MNEALIVKKNNILLALSKLEDNSVFDRFCGTAINFNDFSDNLPSFSQKTVYLCGDISKASNLETELKDAKRVFVIRELSYGYNENKYILPGHLVNISRVPILVSNVGVYYRHFFDSKINYFDRICAEHTFQSLTESTKPGKAHRTGIYLTQVNRDGEDLHFNLLRCSTNLSGSTENFRANDRHIVDALNQEAAYIFQNQAPLNHVLAQIYHNTPSINSQKQTKAKIKAHADKTKDMPVNGIIAFCTFYDQLHGLQPLTEDALDYGYKGVSGLAKLKFRLKKSIAERFHSTLLEKFTVNLYPNSVFFMPLSTNRLYTHEIRSSLLDATKLPTRLGYVVRCSDTEAVHKNGRTFLKRSGKFLELESPTPKGIDELRNIYAEENKTDAFIDYGDKFLFSMNQGDYTAPEYKMEDEFCCYKLPIQNNLFDELMSSVQFENVSKGRKGNVLVKPEASRGVPVVRTTSNYQLPAQCFLPIHENLAQQIQKRASLSIGFNNALIENYTNAYSKMGFHSDQALDLADESYIAIFSCYKYPELANPPRRLVIKLKESSSEAFEIPLIHNSVVVFSLDTNRRFKHKIVLDTSAQPTENQWLGITFRTSKTFVRFRNARPYFEDDIPLALANEDLRREFYSLRSCENRETSFSYPRLTYTISKSDMMIPKPV